MNLTVGKYLIRDWQIEDAPSIAQYANNRKISVNLRDIFPYPYLLSDAEGFLSNVAEQNPRTAFAISNINEAIGGIGLRFGEDVNRYTAEIGYWLAEPFWNKGIMTKVVSRFVDFAFDKFELNRIFAGPYISNPASACVLEKTGFVLEGTLRASAYKDGIVLDQFLYARVRQVIT
jgi:RimJ/RimL family protein N-acetyltransferase